MQYVDYQHMIVNEINEIYLVLILFTCIYKYHIFKLFPIYLMNFHISRFFLNNNVFWSLICKYVYSTINTFFWKIFNLSNIYTTINTNFPNFFHFFFYQIPQVNLLHVPVYNCNFFFWDCTGINIMHTEYFRDVTYCVYTHIRNITFKMYTIAHSWLCVKHFTRIVLSA